MDPQACEDAATALAQLGDAIDPHALGLVVADTVLAAIPELAGRADEDLRQTARANATQSLVDLWERIRSGAAYEGLTPPLVCGYHGFAYDPDGSAWRCLAGEHPSWRLCANVPDPRGVAVRLDLARRAGGGRAAPDTRRGRRLTVPPFDVGRDYEPRVTAEHEAESLDHRLVLDRRWTATSSQPLPGCAMTCSTPWGS